MMGSNHASVALWFAIPTIVDQGRKRHSRSPSPVVVRDEVEIFIPTCLRLFFDYAEYLVDGRVPLTQVSAAVPEVV